MWVNLKIIMKNHEDYILYDFMLAEMMVSYGIRKEVSGMCGDGVEQREVGIKSSWQLWVMAVFILLTVMMVSQVNTRGKI